MKISLRGLTAEQAEARIREVVGQIAADGRRALLTKLLCGESVAAAPSGTDEPVALDVESFDRWNAELEAEREQALQVMFAEIRSDRRPW